MLWHGIFHVEESQGEHTKQSIVTGRSFLLPTPGSDWLEIAALGSSDTTVMCLAITTHPGKEGALENVLHWSPAAPHASPDCWYKFALIYLSSVWLENLARIQRF